MFKKPILMEFRFKIMASTFNLKEGLMAFKKNIFKTKSELKKKNLQIFWLKIKLHQNRLAENQTVQVVNRH